MDIEYLLFLQNLRTLTGGLFDEMLSKITTFGESLMVMIVLCILYWCIENSFATFVMMTYSLNRLANGFLKITFCVYRPWIRDARIQPLKGAMEKATGYSFPSGHTTNAMSVYGSPALWRKVSWFLRISLFLMVGLVGLSRNWLGVHTPQDVIVAIATCAVMALAVRFLTSLLEKHPTLDIWFALIGIAVSIALIAYAALKSYPIDYDASGKVLVDPAKMAQDSYKNAGIGLGFFIGWIIERRFVGFSCEGTIQQRMGRAVIGIIGLFFVLYPVTAGLDLVVPSPARHVVTRAVQMIYVVLIAPWLFKLFERQGSELPAANVVVEVPVANEAKAQGRHFRTA
ncbi:MAG: phosphatase PAP2 family protein [Coriobacteriales bacterium]|jgi:undecaprenyl-diphosphatase|nr:phosphatase PAP2 family protein [Coriobacteriales bacterium]MDO5709918.1 phosphatase PAP2 family protein [Coriobacteriales bacterium]